MCARGRQDWILCSDVLAALLPAAKSASIFPCSQFAASGCGINWRNRARTPQIEFFHPALCGDFISAPKVNSPMDDTLAQPLSENDTSIPWCLVAVSHQRLMLKSLTEVSYSWYMYFINWFNWIQMHGEILFQHFCAKIIQIELRSSLLLLKRGVKSEILDQIFPFLIQSY